MIAATRADRARRVWTWVGLPAAVYLAAAVWLTWPLARQITTHAAGTGYSDSYEVIRHVWWAREALLDGQNPFDQPLLAYPDGFTSWVQWTHPLQYLPPALLALALTPLAAFNVMLLIVLALNGMAAYWLGMTLTGRRALPALVGGLVFLAYPAMQGHLSVGHLGILTLFPLPLFALCAWRVLEGAGWRTALWGGVWFALTALAYVSQITYVLFPLLLFGGLYFLVWDRRRLTGEGAPWHCRPWVKLVAMVAFGGALLVPFYAPLLTAAGRDELGDVAETGRVTFSADLLSFASPSPFGPLDDVVPDYAWDVLGTNSAEGSAYLGLVAVGLAALALWRRPAARVWLVIALGAMLFSLGPLLKWRDDPVALHIEKLDSYVALPWAAFQNLPFIDATRTPGRFNLTTGLAMSALACLGASVLLERIRRRELRAALAVLLGGAILVEYQLFAPFPTGDARQPDVFRDLAARDDVRAVLDVPTDNPLVGKIGLYQQTLHHKPLIAGHALRRTPQDPAVLGLLNRAALGGDEGQPVPAGMVPALFSAAGADRVIVHKPFVSDPGAVVGRLREILGEPDYEDDRLAVFAVPRAEEGSLADMVLVAADADDWSPTVSTWSFAAALMGDAGRWYVYAAGEQYGDLVFRGWAYGSPRRVAAWVDDRLVAGWAVGNGELRLPLRLSPGFHTIRFEALEGCTPYPFEPACWDLPLFAAIHCPPVEQPACYSVGLERPTWEPAGREVQALPVELDQGLRLAAYDVRVDQDERAVDVRLFWEASGPLADDYALFVHVADPATGEPRAQADEYPVVSTRQWDEATRWQSEVRVALSDDLPGGIYAINVGWFLPEPGTRLEMSGERPWAAEGAIFLTDITIE